MFLFLGYYIYCTICTGPSITRHMTQLSAVILPDQTGGTAFVFLFTFSDSINVSHGTLDCKYKFIISEFIIVCNFPVFCDVCWAFQMSLKSGALDVIGHMLSKDNN